VEEVIMAQTNAEEDRLSMTYGIKGIPLLSLVGTPTLLLSFPFDFMHLIFENLVPNLVATTPEISRVLMPAQKTISSQPIYGPRSVKPFLHPVTPSPHSLEHMYQTSRRNTPT
jgi:hypothetical protein